VRTCFDLPGERTDTQAAEMQEGSSIAGGSEFDADAPNTHPDSLSARSAHLANLELEAP